MSQPSKLLRAGSTLAPEFMVKNIMRDSLTASLFSRANTIPILAQFRGLFHMIMGKRFGGEMYQKWIKSGGLQSMVTSMDRTYFAKNVKKELIDVVNAAKEVGNQVGDVGAAVKGKKRQGRKKKK